MSKLSRDDRIRMEQLSNLHDELKMEQLFKVLKIRGRAGEAFLLDCALFLVSEGDKATPEAFADRYDGKWGDEVVQYCLKCDLHLDLQVYHRTNAYMAHFRRFMWGETSYKGARKSFEDFVRKLEEKKLLEKLEIQNIKVLKTRVHHELLSKVPLVEPIPTSCFFLDELRDALQNDFYWEHYASPYTAVWK